MMNKIINKVFGDDALRGVYRWIAATLMVLSLFLLVKFVSALKYLPSVGNEVYPQSSITVTGEGEAYAIPDIANFSFTVTETADTIKAAQDKSNEKISAALKIVRDLGVDDKDIKTTDYSAYPKYEWQQAACTLGYCPSGKNVLVGYEVSQTITVKVRDTEKVSDMVAKVGETPISNIGSIQFGIDDEEKYVSQARDEAIVKAKIKAKELSKQLGVKLGKFMYYTDYNDNGGYSGMGGSDKIMMTASSVQIPQGQTKITMKIGLTYEVK